MKKSFGFSKIAESDQLFSWVMLVSLVIYINFSLFFILAKRPEVKEVNQEILKRRIAKLIVKADFGELEKRNVKIESKNITEEGTEGSASKEKKEEPGGKEGKEEEKPSQTGKEDKNKGAEKAGKAGESKEKARERVRNVGLLAELTGKGRSSKKSSGASGLLGNSEVEKNLDNVLSGLDGVKIAEAGEKAGPGGKRGLIEGNADGGEKLVSLFSDKASSSENVSLEREGALELSGPGPIKGAGSSSTYRTATQINEVVKSHIGSLEYCYNRKLKRNPDLQGRIVIKFTIKADGSVSDCKTVESTMNDSDVENCIIRSIRRWKFSPISEGDAEIVYPFMFFHEE